MPEKSPPIEVYPIELNRKKGYDLRIASNKANLQQYMNSLEEAFDKYAFDRFRNNVPVCEGCPHCCNERIPVTSVDIYNIAKFLNIDIEEKGISNFIGRYCYVAVEGPAADITLRQKADGYCIYLDKDNRCRIYPVRPLVCKTYFCCSAAKRADELRETVVNQGEDELVRLWLADIASRQLPLSVDESWEPNLDLSDWGPNPFTGKKAYSEILIRDLCSPRLWAKLTDHR